MNEKMDVLTEIGPNVSLVPAPTPAPDRPSLLFFYTTESGELNTESESRLGGDADVSLVMMNDIPGKLLLAYIVILVTVVVLLNGCIYFAVLYLKRNRFNPSNFIVLNLATTDLMVALVYLPILATFIIRETKERCLTFCSVLSILERTFVAESAWSVVLVSIDRYLFVVRHAKYRSIMTLRRAFYGVMISWVISFTFGATSYVVNSTHDPSKSGGICSCHFGIDFYGVYHLIFSAAYIALCLIIPTTLMFIFYGFVIKVARHHARNRHKNPFRLRKSRVGADEEPFTSGDNNHVPGSSHQQYEEQKGVRLYRVKAARIIFSVLSIHLLCFTPYFVLNIMLTSWPYEHETSKSSVNLYLTFVLILQTPSAFNPLFYGFSNRRLRTSLIAYMKKKFLKLNGAGQYGPGKRGGSKLSIMADTSSGTNRRGSRASDISALSAMSTSAFVCRDLLEAYSFLPTEDATAHTTEHKSATYTQSGRRKNKTTQSSLDDIDNTGSDSYAFTDCDPQPSSPDFLARDRNAGQKKNKSGTSNKIGSVPVKQQLVNSDSKRSLALRKIAEAAMLFSVSDDESHHTSEGYRTQGGFTPRSPTIAWNKC